jgi:hypothetical protein
MNRKRIDSYSIAISAGMKARTKNGFLTSTGGKAAPSIGVVEVEAGESKGYVRGCGATFN